MSTTARVVEVTPTRKHDAARTQIDIVSLTWDGKRYTWSSEPGRYAVGQEVPVNPPVSPAANITPRIA